MRRERGNRWPQVLIQSAQDLRASNAPEWAAALAFYAVLSLFPLLLLAVVGASYLVDATWAVGQATDLLGAFVPRGQIEIEEIVAAAIDERGRVGILSAVLFLVTGRRVLGALTTGLNRVSDVDEQTDSLRRRVLVEFALLAGLAALFLLALSARPLLDFAWRAVRFVPGTAGPAFRVLQELLRVLLLLAAFTLVYAVVPRGERHWRAAVIGAGAATALFVVAQTVFVAVLDPLWDNLSLVYGPLAVAALLLSWAWYVGLITLAGGTLASHTKVMLVEGKSPLEAGRRHIGRAPAPDTPT